MTDRRYFNWRYVMLRRGFFSMLLGVLVGLVWTRQSFGGAISRRVAEGEKYRVERGNIPLTEDSKRVMREALEFYMACGMPAELVNMGAANRELSLYARYRLDGSMDLSKPLDPDCVKWHQGYFTSWQPEHASKPVQ